VVGSIRQALAERIGEWSPARYPETPWQRADLRMPILLWRLGLGRLAGPLMLLTVTGRSSGLPRRTPVTAHVVAGRTYLWCPYGGRSQWYRNLLANPVATTQSRRGTQAVRAVAVDDEDEAVEVVAELRRFNPPWLRRYLEGEGIADTLEDIARNTQRLHIRRLEPTSVEGPPELTADLAWLWLLPVALAALLARRRRH
jgi:deazaflavin-dependent oxidoreductase (nitroreductase family)